MAFCISLAVLKCNKRKVLSNFVIKIKSVKKVHQTLTASTQESFIKIVIFNYKFLDNLLRWKFWIQLFKQHVAPTFQIITYSTSRLTTPSNFFCFFITVSTIWSTGYALLCSDELSHPVSSDNSAENASKSPVCYVSPMINGPE